MIEIVLLYLSPYFIVFASEDSSAAISGLERTFASSSASTPSGTATVFCAVFGCICGSRSFLGQSFFSWD